MFTAGEEISQEDDKIGKRKARKRDLDGPNCNYTLELQLFIKGFFLF